MASAAHNADDPFMRPGRCRAVHDRRSADGRLACAGVRPGSGDDPPGLQGLDDGLVSGCLAPPAAVLHCPRCRGVLAGRGDGVGRRGLRLLREGAGRHAQADRCVPVQGRPDAGRLRGPRRRAAPLLPHGQQADWEGPLSSPGSGRAAGRWAERLDSAVLRDGGQGVHRVRGHARRAGPLRRRDGRGVHRHAGRLPGQDRRAEAVRPAVLPQVRLRRRAGRAPPWRRRSRR